MRLRSRIVLDVLSGFLGSGKTTLLRHHLAALGDAPDVALIINEFGATSIDHRLVRISDDTTRVLADGCACCTVADRLRVTLLELLREDAGTRSTPLKRIILETSGLADPASILNTIRADMVLAEYIDIGACVVAFDALDGVTCADRYPEVKRQLAAADLVVITKTDIASPTNVELTQDLVRSVNPLAQVLSSASAAFSAATLFDVPVTHRAETSGPALHAANISSFTVTLGGAVDWADFSVWLTCLLNRHGERILRFKAVLDTGTAQWPLVVHGVRHLVYPPKHIPELSQTGGRSDLVFIVSDLEPERIEESLQQFLSFAALTPKASAVRSNLSATRPEAARQAIAPSHGR